MPKIKTNRGAAKRFGKTGTGKIRRNKAYASHILTKKTTKRKRGLRRATLVDAAITYDIGQVSLGLHAQNLLDEKYVATAFDSSGTYGTRREVTGSVSYHF